MNILVGCCGMPGGLSAYAKVFPIVEINSTFYRLPRASTAQRWRETVPPDFIFCMKAFQGVTHPASSPTWKRFGPLPANKEKFGGLQDTREVRDAWQQTLKIGGILRAATVLIQTPAAFKDEAGNRHNARRFFSTIERDQLRIAIELRGWRDETVRDLCAEFDLIDCRDPFAGNPVAFGRGSTAYLRLHGVPPGKRMYAHRYTAADLHRLQAMVEALPVADALVFFNNLSMAEDAAAFQTLVTRP